MKPLLRKLLLRWLDSGAIVAARFAIYGRKFFLAGYKAHLPWGREVGGFSLQGREEVVHLVDPHLSWDLVIWVFLGPGRALVVMFVRFFKLSAQPHSFLCCS